MGKNKALVGLGIVVLVLLGLFVVLPVFTGPSTSASLSVVFYDEDGNPQGSLAWGVGGETRNEFKVTASYSMVLGDTVDMSTLSVGGFLTVSYKAVVSPNSPDYQVPPTEYRRDACTSKNAVSGSWVFSYFLNDMLLNADRGYEWNIIMDLDLSALAIEEGQDNPAGTEGLYDEATATASFSVWWTDAGFILTAGVGVG